MSVLDSLGGYIHSAGGYLLPFLFVLIIVVFIHELGHFLVGQLVRHQGHRVLDRLWA